MALELITDAAIEPILYQNVIDHLRINPFDEEIDEASIAYIETLIRAVRNDVETFTSRSLITQTWRLYLDAFPGESYIEIPKPPLQTISSVKYIDSDGTETPMVLTTDYLVDSVSKESSRCGRIVLPYSGSWPSATLHPVNPIVIEFVCGYGLLAEDVPKRIIQAMLLEIASLYENRETIIVGKTIQRLDVYERLLWPFRVKVV